MTHIDKDGSLVLHVFQHTVNVAVKTVLVPLPFFSPVTQRVSARGESVRTDMQPATERISGSVLAVTVL